MKNRPLSCMMISLMLLTGFLTALTTQVGGLEYAMDSGLGTAQASFIGEDPDDYSAWSVDITGDVNGDGYDDILIGAKYNDEYASFSGQTYLVLGRSSGWAMDKDLATVNASFRGESSMQMSGEAVAFAGDVNGDDHDDILIGAFNDDENGSTAGQVYLIMGAASGWRMDQNLSQIGYSFIGGPDDQLGKAVDGAGDVNADGYDDILIGAPKNEEGGFGGGQTYLFFGKADGWERDTNMSMANASFIGEEQSSSGQAAAGAGDVNGDGYDDIMIGAPFHTNEGINHGAVYVILGKASGWERGFNISNASASYHGESFGSNCGISVAGAGDVDGDGYDDIIMGATGFDNHKGKVYLMYGKDQGWEKGLNLTQADAAFIGEANGNNAGRSISGAGDVNGDGFDDILIGAYRNDEAGTFTGQTYLILGAETRFSGNISLVSSDASFRGENNNDYSGFAVSGGGDADGDGYDDILIGAYGHSNGGANAGQTYVIMPDVNSGPGQVTSVRAFLDEAMTQEVSTDPVLLHQAIYVELTGIDSDPTSKDMALVDVTSSITSPVGLRLRLTETDIATGTYRGNFTVSDRTHEGHRLVKVGFAEDVTVSSVLNRSANVTFRVVDPPVLWPLVDNGTAQEDQLYKVQYWSVGDPVSEWVFDTNASWLGWNSTSHELSGTPDNADVGPYWVRINITNGVGYYDEHVFALEVNNSPPEILTTDVMGAHQGQVYEVDYNSSDDGQGNITWHLSTNATWLDINGTTGVLSGTPANDHVGRFVVNVSVNDGNGGWDRSSFELTVANVNDRPTILTGDVTTTLEDLPYNVTYTAVDIDIGDNIFWSFATNATWLDMNQDSGRVFGIPGNQDVGPYWVNVTITDSHLASDSHNFTLEVLNVNDPPVITSLPVLDAKVFDIYEYQVEATDIDAGDTLAFALDLSPASMTISSSGHISWMPTREQKGLHLVTVNVTDGNATVLQTFNMTVTVPQVTLTSPDNGSKVDTLTPELHWEFSETDIGPIIYDIYLATDPSASILLRSGHDRTGLKPLALIDNTTYYWKVVPRTGDLTGEASPIWSFQLKLELVPEYKVRLDLDKNDAIVHRGDRLTINMTVYNDGNVQGQINITIETALPSSMFASEASVRLMPGASKVIQLNISVPKNAPIGNHEVFITAQFQNGTSMKVLTLSIEKRIAPVVVPLWEDPMFWGILIIVISLAVVGVAYVTHRRRKAEQEFEAALAKADEIEDFHIDEIFMIYNDGRLITHVSHKKSSMDKQLFSGMLIAIRNFVKESFKEDSGLSSFEFGNRKMVIEKGQYMFLVVALSGTEPKILRPNMGDLLGKIEALYAAVLDKWDGDTSHFKDAEYDLTPLFYIKEGLKIKKAKEEVRVLSGVEFFSGFVRLKVAIKNELSMPIKDIELTLDYDDRLLQLSHIEPEYPQKGNVTYIDQVGKDEKRTVAFYLDPLICQESKVDCRATFKDEFGKPGEVVMKTRPVDIACPIFYTPESINVAMLKRLLERLKYSDTKIYRISQEVPMQKIYDIAKKAVQKHDIKLVREYSEFEPFANEAWYYGSAKENDEELVVRVTVREDTGTLEMYVASGNLSTMTGLLAELGHNMNLLVVELGYEVFKPSTDKGLKEYLEKKPKLIDKVLETEIQVDDDLMQED